MSAPNHVRVPLCCAALYGPMAPAAAAQYLGCYTDSNAPRRLPVRANQVETARFVTTGGLAGGSESLDSCFTAALAGGYRLFGAAAGMECWLGNDTTLAGLVAASSCVQVCVGNTSQICGGSSTVLSLYSIRGGCTHMQ